MAIWSYSYATKGNDPGYIEWEHFRTHAQLADHDDRLKWSDPVYKEKKANQKYEVDAEDNMGAVQSHQCRKCGAMRAFGTHHCGTCKRCVYRMDHHCPWTNNCVGYLTIKPFILFLFYVQGLMLWELLMAYKIAWDKELMYISPL
jgi:hypothetical protein|tara:strand:- start:74 stop:508 length:435 start_codon:yes stop_codon:yes gene_type:complete